MVKVSIAAATGVLGMIYYVGNASLKRPKSIDLYGSGRCVVYEAS
jgi:hypothetical protein